MTPHGADDKLAGTVEADAASVLSVLIRELRDFDLAEDALQDALAEAVVVWRRDGPPHNGAGWLLTVARRRAIDRLRRARRARDESVQQALLAQLEAEDQAAEDDQPIPDERLRLIFTCCHPALSPEAQVALTLRTLCGLSTPSIARAFLVSETTMAQRLVRAKRKIRAARIAYEVPEGTQLDARQAIVRGVIYLIFNEGFAATEGVTPTRANLCQEAIRLGRVLFALQPDPETGGLLALMLLHDSRRTARGGEGTYVPIAEQDRRRWDRTAIAEGQRLLYRCLAAQRPGPYQLQAAISSVHADAMDAQSTDWPQIDGLYRALEAMTRSPVVTLNRAVATAHVAGPQAALALLEPLADKLGDYQPFHAAKADLWRQLGLTGEAASAYDRAIELSTNKAEQTFLAGRRNALLNPG